ncbi:PIG-X [Boletus edulis BED1]|uniref:Protein PBN1 n=1 Tax=Boletus edulis BED1 TaxID=1328754 RepID=A0AAD4BQ16_BOLED|nr:PIG-X [Boletus edulis BED1]
MSLTVMSHFLQPQHGFHSTLSTIFALDPPLPDCSFFTLYTLPQTIIIDRHELMDRRLSFEFWGESNLELPVFALNQTANSLLLMNATVTGARPKQVAVDIPVHARYGEPGTHPLVITIPSPTFFWGCPLSASVSSSVFSSESPLANSTLLSSLAYFSVPSASSYLASLQVPVASKRDLFPVEMGTATVILMAFLWLVNRSWRVATALQSCHLKEQ